MQLVFIHGSGGTGRVWKHQLERFTDALAITLPGHPDGAHLGSIEKMTRWLRDELQKEGISAPVLAGHSLGGAIALQYALDHPGEAAGLCLVGSGARLRVHPATLGALENAIDAPETFTAMMADAWSKVDDDFAAEMRALSSELGPLPFLNDLKACDQFDVTDRLAEIDTPTLAVVGTADVMTPPKYSEFMRDRMPNASVEIIEGGTHFVFAEQPEPVNRAIAAFVERLGEA